MSKVGKSEGKKRGRPPGSKNKKRVINAATPRSQIKAIGDDSIEETIRHVLDMPASTETKIKLIKATLNL